jgi:hypothetical protein
MLLATATTLDWLDYLIIFVLVIVANIVTRRVP